MAAEYEFFDDAMVDDGQLKGLKSNEIFMLGVEWAMVRQSVAEGKPFSRPVHAENRQRIEEILKKRGDRRWSLTYMAEDRSESWMWLEVGPKLEDWEGGHGD